MSAVIALKALQPRTPTPPKFEVTCSSCNLREMCLPGALCAEDLARVESVVYARRRVKRGDALFNAGAALPVGLPGVKLRMKIKPD